MSFELFAAQNRTEAFSITLYQADGVTGLTLQSADVVRVKIGRGVNAILDIDSVTALAGGSFVTVTQLSEPATVSLLLAQGDLAGLAAGPYDVEISIVDSSDSNRIKPANTGVLDVMLAMGGNVGLTP